MKDYIIDKLYKTASTQNWKWNLFKTLFQTSLFWLLFLYIIPQSILYLETKISIPNFTAQPILGWLFFIPLGLIGTWSGITMSLIGKGTPLPTDCPNRLVVEGPYRFLRNPMAFAGIGQGMAVGLMFGSYAIILYALSAAPLWHIVVRPSEERDLLKRFGEQYKAYQKNVICWIPRIIPYSQAQEPK